MENHRKCPFCGALHQRYPIHNLKCDCGARYHCEADVWDLFADALSLINELTLTLEGVMHFVDKWLDGAELEKDEVNRAITMREKTLQIVEKLTEENERLKARVLEENHLRHQAEEMLANGMSLVKADTVRKMQEQLKMEIDRFGRKDGFITKETVCWFIDKIAKEMEESVDEG